MSDSINSVGAYIQDYIKRKNLSQRDLSSALGIAPTVLNDLLKGKRNITVKTAVLLEAAGIGKASELMLIQMNSMLEEEQSKLETIKKKTAIQNWNEVRTLIPISYIKKHIELKNNAEDDEKIVYNLFGVKDLDDLKNHISHYKFTHFKKSSALKEERNNVIAWSSMAEYKAAQMNVPKFNKSCENELLTELKQIINKNKNTYKNVEKTLINYGIKFFVLDRPSKTPVSGKSFVSGKNPAIVLTLKYKRLDNFAFTLFHELAHVFKHLDTRKNEKVSFFIGNKGDAEELEADKYAQDNLIDREAWQNFMFSNFSYSDSTIKEFAKEVNIHPAIVRGRVCHEFNEYYRMRSSITSTNILT